MKDPQVKLRLSSRAKHPHLKVSPWGLVELIWPKDLDQRYIPKLSHSQKAWINERLNKVRSNYSDDEKLPNKIHFCALDETWSVDYQLHHRSKIIQHPVDNSVTIRGKEDKHGELMIKWLKLYGKQKLLPWLEHISKRHKIPYDSARIANQKTRWGSCSQNKVISLNCKLLFLQPELVEYLLIHELCHTHYMDHSKDYWAMVGRFEKNYRELDKKINEAHFSVPMWAYRY